MLKDGTSLNFAVLHFLVLHFAVLTSLKCKGLPSCEDNPSLRTGFSFCFNAALY